MQCEQAHAWLLNKVVPRINDLWIPKRVKEWVPGKRPVQKPEVDGMPESSSEDEDEDAAHAGHHVWREVAATVMELAAWRFFIK